MIDFSISLKKAREAKHVSQERLEKASGISQAAISKIESGAASPTIYTAQKLADALGVSLVELITGAPYPPAAPVVYSETPLTETERQLISDFRTLNKQGRETILQQMYMCKKIWEQPDDISAVANQ
jgi:transcriptional regulator with XRE-family HTH domain